MSVRLDSFGVERIPGKHFAVRIAVDLETLRPCHLIGELRRQVEDVLKDSGTVRRYLNACACFFESSTGLKNYHPMTLSGQRDRRR